MLPLLLCLFLAADHDQQPPSFRTTVPLVVAPTTVTGRGGQFIDGLQARDFAVYVDGRRQSVDAETEREPISLVIAVQANGNADAALAKVRKIGSLFEPLVLGQRGEAAILTFSDEVTTALDFTSDSASIRKTLAGIRGSGSGARLLDAIDEAARLLAPRPANRRRVILFIGETKDRGSKTRIEDVVGRAQKGNVLIYAATFSAYATPFTAKPQDAPQAGGLNLFVALAEIGRLGKANAATALTSYTGGRHVPFLRLRGLEQAVSAIGEELHSQYILSFTPSARADGRYHRIEVRVPARPDAVVRSRAGFWITGE